MLLLPLTLLFMTLLAGCGGVTPISPSELQGASERLDSTVFEMQVSYYVTVSGVARAGAAGYRAGRCVVLLERTLLERYPTLVASTLAHELAHCYDRHALGFRHNGFRDEGCVLGAYFCDPKEGFAETYARLYTATCGTSAQVLGFFHDDIEDTDDAPTCTAPPNPLGATPAWLRAQHVR